MPSDMDGFTSRRPRALARAQLVLSLYMIQPNSLLTNLKKENFGQI